MILLSSNKQAIVQRTIDIVIRDPRIDLLKRIQAPDIWEEILHRNPEINNTVLVSKNGNICC